MWRAGGREGIGLRRLGCVCGRRLVTASCVPRETILKGPPRPGPRVPLSISPSLYLSTSLAAAPPNPNPNPNPDPDPDPNPNPNQSPLECEGQPRPKASRPGRPLGVSRAVAVGPPRRRRHFHDMRPGWNLRRQSARLWKSTVRSCQARCAAPHASPAPSAGTWTPGAAPALLTPGRSNAAASAGSSTSAAWEAAGSSTRGRGRAACGSALPLGATRRPEPPGAAAALRRRSSRPEEAQQPP